MDSSQQILQLLQAHAGTPLSGNYIGQKLQISRTAVWKAIRKLQKNGFTIKACAREGYLLSGNCADMLTKDGMLACLAHINPEAASKIKLFVHGTVSSTQDLLAQQAQEGASAGTCVAATQQLSGRGRRGHQFFSPPGGVYISLLLRPPALKISMARWVSVSATLAACEAIEDVLQLANLDMPVKIKWLNDIFIGNKKVCGVLSEARCNLDNELIDYVILGAGFNLYPPEGELPEHLRDLMGALLPPKQQINEGKNYLAAAFVSRVFSQLNHFDRRMAAEQFRNRSNLLGRSVTLISENSRCKAQVIDIDEDCRLQVRFNDGTRAALSGGEISLQPDP